MLTIAPRLVKTEPLPALQRGVWWQHQFTAVGIDAPVNWRIEPCQQDCGRRCVARR